MSRVIVVGSANTDLTVRVQNLPREGETVTGWDFQVSYGGKGANQALAALHCGAEVLFIARIGTDTYGRDLARHFKKSGLPGSGMYAQDGHPAGLALIHVDSQGHNQITVVPGSNDYLSPADVQACADWFTSGSVLLTQLEIPISTVTAGLELAKSRGMTCILNPAPYFPIPAKALAATDIMTPNLGEAAALTGVDCTSPSDLEPEIRHLFNQGPHTAIITLGQDGVMVCNQEGKRQIPSFPVQAVDTVGAGDAFNGALAAALARGCNLDSAVRLACAAGALAATKTGAQSSLPGQLEVEALASLQFRQRT